MKPKAALSFILAVILLFVCCSAAFAASDDPDHWQNEKDHNRWTRFIIFGNVSTSFLPSDIQQKIDVLLNAVLLCIDQYNSNYKGKLTFLNEMNVRGLPKSIDEFDFSAGPDHRRYTHRGWYFDYTKYGMDKGHAEIRRNILRNSVEYIFKFDKTCKDKDEALKMRDAMSNLLYVSHILGDRFHSKQYYGAASTLLLANDSKEQETVITDLKNCLPVLFPDKKSEVNNIVKNLNTLSGEFISEQRANPSAKGMREVDTIYALKIRDLLGNSLIKLLKEEEWFKNAFTSPLFPEGMF